ncbi:MAG TPA: ParB N-terminal domain-containing protein [Isosphaeraceae bacterium]|nr:ParB N-terminal domain-containing protein [Isosphaeraceae bacterium]
MFNRKSEEGKGTKPTPQAEPRSPAEQRATRIRLNQFDRSDLRFFLREPKHLQEEHLKDLLPSVQHEGLQAPVEFFQDGPRKVLVKGHRRVAACIILCKKGAPGFLADMELDAIEVLETDPRELLVRCVLDNSVRKNLDQVDRIRVARSLFLAGVPEARAAEALGISVQSYKRDLSIAECPWIFNHVVANNISPTPAATILRAVADAAEEYPGILEQVQEELDQWIEAKRRWIDRRDKVLKANKGRGKGLSEADRQVKRYLSNQLAEHWAELIRQGDSLDEDTEWTFQVDLDPDKDLLQIGGVRLNLAKDPARKLAEVASKLSQLAKDLGPFLQKRFQEEKLQQKRSSGRTIVRDTKYLKDLGLDSLASEFEQELAEPRLEGEEDADFDQVEPRPECDLADEVESPDSQPGEDPQADVPSDEEAAR